MNLTLQPSGFVCMNCGSESLRVLNRADAALQPIVTSDAYLLDEVRVTRTLCERCACLQVHYDPPDRLARHFAYDYDVSDEVQSNLIVRNGQAVRKHDHIQVHLKPALEQLPEQGRFLEIACGKGHLVRDFRRKHSQWECYGIDPSCQGAAGTKDLHEGGHFIRDYFSPDHFEGRFDVIVAHGFLNRSPTLPELKRITQLCRPGGLVSLELLVLENSVFTPYTWDHPFMYLADTFDVYLKHVGLSVVRRTDCVSSVHFLCRYDYEQIKDQPIVLPSDGVDRTEHTYQQQHHWWEQVLANAKKFMKGRTSEWGLYGAGLYNAILLSHLPNNDISFVIDEVKAGQEYFGRPVVTAAQAAEKSEARVLVCARPEYVSAMTAKLREQAIAFHVLNPQENPPLELDNRPAPKLCAMSQ